MIEVDTSFLGRRLCWFRANDLSSQLRVLKHILLLGTHPMRDGEILSKNAITPIFLYVAIHQ
jgi:hypothetical protein